MNSNYIVFDADDLTISLAYALVDTINKTGYRNQFPDFDISNIESLDWLGSDFALRCRKAISIAIDDYLSNLLSWAKPVSYDNSLDAYLVQWIRLYNPRPDRTIIFEQEWLPKQIKRGGCRQSLAELFIQFNKECPEPYDTFTDYFEDNIVFGWFSEFVRAPIVNTLNGCSDDTWWRASDDHLIVLKNDGNYYGRKNRRDFESE